MVIDFHTHLFPDKIAEKTIQTLAGQSHLTPFSNGRVEGLINEMQEGNVSLSVALPVVTKPEQFESITKFARSINEQYGEGARRILSFGGVHPASSRYKEELRELKELGFKGIKLHPDYQGAYFHDIEYQRIVDEAGNLGLIISVHAGVDVGFPEPVHCPPKQALEVIKAVKPEKLVLAHLGGWKQWEQVYELLAGQEVYFDTAVAFGACPDNLFKKIVQKHGNDKILFATDSPWTGQKESIEYLKSMGFDQETEEKIFYKNACELLNGGY